METALEGLGAFLSGAAAVLTGAWAVRGVQRAERKRCDERVAEVRATYDAGLDRGLAAGRDREGAE